MVLVIRELEGIDDLFLSILIKSYNETKHLYFWLILQSLSESNVSRF